MLQLEINVPKRAKHIFSNNHSATLGRVFKMLKKVEKCQNEISQMCIEAEQIRLRKERMKMESRKLQTPSIVDTTIPFQSKWLIKPRYYSIIIKL